MTGASPQQCAGVALTPRSALHRSTVAFSAALLLLCACASAPPARPALASAIEQLIAQPPLDHAVWGIDVEDEAGRTLFDRNAHRLMIPASNRKLFSVATDVNCLGAGNRLSTELWLDGEDVVLRGDGDPSFGSARLASPGVGPLVEALRARGVTRVRDVVADVSRFDRLTVPRSWKVGFIPDGDATPVDALAFDENFVGEKAVPDPGLFAAQQLRDALVLGGIEVTGTMREVVTGGPCSPSTAPESCVRVGAVESPLLVDLLAVVLKNSHNLYAEMLFKRSSEAGTYDDSLAKERSFAVAEAGVDPNEFRFVDGSGLAPDDLVAPSAVVRLLRWMNAPERRGLFWTILAQPANDGTLRRRITDLADRMRGKTGTLNGVNALSGIVRGRNGGYRYFSIIVNHHLAAGDQSRGALDAIAEKIADF